MVARRNNFYRFKARHYATRAQDLVPSAEAIRARKDLNFFIEYISGLPVGNQYHENWAKVWATGNSNDLLNKIAGANVNILAPRSSAKSTRLGYAVAWAIGHNPGLPILYISYAKPIAVSRSRLIKRIINHPRYTEVFPHIKPNKDKWSDTEWEIDKKTAGVTDLSYDYTLLAVGISGAIVSKRAGLIVVDDPIKNRSSILNPDVREKIRNNWRTAVLPTLLPGSRIWGIGTRFHKDDIHVTDLCPEKGVEVLEQGAIIIDNHGVERSYWESFAPYHDRIIEHEDGSQEIIRGLFEKREEDPVTFAFQMQNTIVSEYDVAIEESWIQWTEDIPNVDEFDQFAFGLDLAAREREQFDFTACVLLGKKGNRIYVLDGGRGRWPGNLDKINMILTMAYDWQLVRGIRDPETNDLIFKEVETVYVPIHAEDVNYQASLQSDWNTVVRDQYQIYNLRCIGAKAKGDKATRLKATTGTFQRKEIFFNSWRRKSLTPLIVELINFGSTTHDDYADAFAYGVNGIQKRSSLTSA